MSASSVAPKPSTPPGPADHSVGTTAPGDTDACPDPSASIWVRQRVPLIVGGVLLVLALLVLALLPSLLARPETAGNPTHLAASDCGKFRRAHGCWRANPCRCADCACSAARAGG